MGENAEQAQEVRAGLKLKSDLKDAFILVSAIRKSKKPKQTLTDFLNEL